MSILAWLITFVGLFIISCCGCLLIAMVLRTSLQPGKDRKR